MGKQPTGASQAPVISISVILEVTTKRMYARMCCPTCKRSITRDFTPTTPISTLLVETCQYCQGGADATASG